MDKPVKVSVLMPVYNTKEEWLRQAIESILNQTLKEIELVIVLDCPTDSSDFIVSEYAKKDGRIRVERNHKRMGIVSSLNKAISAAQGDIVARMDSDDIAFPDRLEKQLIYLKTTGLDLIGSRFEKIDQDGNKMGCVSRAYKPEDINRILSKICIIPHPTYMLYKSVYEALGGYRQIDACEDYDLLLRAKGKGFKIGLCDEALLYYRTNTTGISGTRGLSQFLVSRYIMNNQRHLSDMDPAKISTLMGKKCTDAEQKKYDMATQDIQAAKMMFAKKDLIKGTAHLIRACIRSKHTAYRLFASVEQKIVLRNV